MRLKPTINESTLSTAARFPFPMEKAAIQGCGFSRIVKANTGYVEKNNTDERSLPLEGEGASKGRIRHWRYEKEWGYAFQAGDFRQQPSTDFLNSDARKQPRKQHGRHKSIKAPHP